MHSGRCLRPYEYRKSPRQAARRTRTMTIEPWALEKSTVRFGTFWKPLRDFFVDG